MLPAVHRMRLSSDFEAAVRRGRRSGRRCLVVHVFVREPDGATAEPARVGFVVSRAVGTAVVRTRVKRRLRAVMAARTSMLPAGSLIVVRANPAAAGADSSVLASDVDAALPRALPRSAAAIDSSSAAASAARSGMWR
jgi:ribonuclease P protein component